jgi:hypothetical protein
LGPSQTFSAPERDMMADQIDSVGIGLNIAGMLTMFKKHAQSMAKIIEEDNNLGKKLETRRLNDLKTSPSLIRKNFFGKFSSLNSSPFEELLSDDSMSGTTTHFA